MGSGTLVAADATRLYQQAAQIANIGGWEYAFATDDLSWTDGVYDLFGLARGSTLHRQSTVEQYQEDSRILMQQLRGTAISQGHGFSLKARINRPGGELRWMRLIANVAYDCGRPIRIFGSKQDITSEKQMWDTLAGIAHRDPLTGLANRLGFEAAFRDAIIDGDRMTALLVIDLDRLEVINQRFGRTTGDECLRQISTRIGRIFGDATLVARIGGDEFAVLLSLPSRHSQLTSILNAARQLLSRPLHWNNTSIEAPVSIGATVMTSLHRDDPAKLFAEADAALLLAKTAGRGRVRIFDGAIGDRIVGVRPQLQSASARTA